MVTPVEFRQNLWLQKARVHELSYGVVCVTFSGFDRTATCDRHAPTEGRDMYDDSINRTAVEIMTTAVHKKTNFSMILGRYVLNF